MVRAIRGKAQRWRKIRLGGAKQNDPPTGKPAAGR
jgi:hypothetical protein